MHRLGREMRFSLVGRSTGAGSTGPVEKDIRSEASECKQRRLTSFPFSALRQARQGLICAAQPMGARDSLSVTKGKAAKMTTSIFSFTRSATHICAVAMFGMCRSFTFTHSAHLGSPICGREGRLP